MTGTSRRVLAMVVLLVSACLASVGAKALLQAGWTSVVEYRSPYVFDLQPGSADSPTSSVAQSVVVVVVDGLRADVAFTKEHILEAAARGASRRLTCGQPSLSLPTWTTIATGAFQETTGVTTNWWKPGGAFPDTIFAAARRAGKRVVVIGDVGWDRLFGKYVSEGYYEDSAAGDSPESVDARIFEKAFAVLAEASRQPETAGVVVVHFSCVDAAGESYGTIGQEYADAVNAVDAWIGRLARLVDPLRSVMVVTSDHGQVAKGGHGGWEPDVVKVPLVAYGKGIAPGRYPDSSQADLAPTLCALIGCGFPRHAEGDVMWDMLALAPFERSEKTIRLAETRSRFAAAYCSSGGHAASRPWPGEELIRKAYIAHNDKSYEAAAGLAAQALAQARSAIMGARKARLVKSRMLRIPVALVLTLASFLPLAALVAFRPRWRYAAALGVTCYFVVYYALWVARGFTFSLSVFRKESLMLPFFNGRMLDAALAGVMGCAVAGAACRTAAGRRPWDVLLCSATVVHLVLAGLVVQAVPFVAAYGWRFTALLPDFRQAFKYYVDLLQLVAVGLAAAPMAAAGWLGALGVDVVAAAGRGLRRRSARVARVGTLVLLVSGLIAAALLLSGCGAGRRGTSGPGAAAGPGSGTGATGSGASPTGSGAGQVEEVEFFGLPLYPGALVKASGSPPPGGSGSVPPTGSGTASGGDFGQVEAQTSDGLAAVEDFYTRRFAGPSVQRFDFTDDEGYRTVVLIEKAPSRLRSVTVSGKAGEETVIQLKSVERKQQ